MRIQTVAHLWRYSRLACYHLSSLLLAPPTVKVQVTIYRADCDAQAAAACLFFGPRLRDVGVDLDEQVRSRELVCRRGILRNEAAKHTTADWVWFCDIDTVFGPGCVDTLPPLLAGVPADCPLVYPEAVWATTQDAGDRLINALDGPTVAEVPIAGLQRMGYSKAIGGAQIVRGDVARAKGYCPDHKRAQRPAINWVRTHEDVHFRRLLGTDGVPIPLANLLRIRHTRRGGHGSQEVHL